MYRRSTLSRIVRALLTAAVLAVCVVPALAQPTAATVLEQIGQVSLLKDGNQVALFVGQGIKRDQVIVTGPGSYAKFRVSDGTEFEVFEKSQITFREQGGSWKDLLNIWIGHVKVYVQHLLGPNPTDVTSPTAVISVRGTVFDVLVENEDGDTIVSVDEGAVAIRHRLLPNGVVPVLKPGESYHIYHNQPLIGQQINKGGGMQKVFQQIQKAVIDYIRMRPGGVGGSPVPGGGPAGGGAQGDKSKNGGAGAGNPTGKSGGAGNPTGTSGGGGAPPPPGGH